MLLYKVHYARSGHGAERGHRSGAVDDGFNNNERRRDVRACTVLSTFDVAQAGKSGHFGSLGVCVRVNFISSVRGCNVFTGYKPIQFFFSNEKSQRMKKAGTHGYKRTLRLPALLLTGLIQDRNLTDL